MKTISYWKILWRVCEITVMIHFNFRLIRCSLEDLLFKNISRNMLVDILKLQLLTQVKKCQLETPFESDDVNTSIKRQISKLLFIISQGKFRKCHCLFCFFLVLVSKQWFNKGLDFPLKSERSLFNTSIKIKRHVSTGAALEISAIFHMEIFVGWSSLSSTCQNFFFFFFVQFYVPFKIISLISRRANQKVGRKREYPGKNHLTHPQVELDLSHLWPVWGSNPHQSQRWDDRMVKGDNEISHLNHSAKLNIRSDVDKMTHIIKLLNLFCIYPENQPSYNSNK